MVDVTEAVKNVFHVKYVTQQELASTFLRFQEHYESPEFKGKIFTLEQYVDWYMKNSPVAMSKGKFTFYEEWDGFNIPSNVLEPFYQGSFDPLSLNECSLLEAFAVKRKQDFYIIGTCDTTPRETFLHELAHGLFAVDKKYRKEAMKIVDHLNPTLSVKITDYLVRQAVYTPEVFPDEIHAYIVALTDLTDDAKIPIEDLRESHSQLRWLLHRYCSKKK